MVSAFDPNGNGAYDLAGAAGEVDVLHGWALRNLFTMEGGNEWLTKADHQLLRGTYDVRYWSKATAALRRGRPRGMDDSGARSCIAERLFVLESYPYASTHNPRITDPAKVLPTLQFNAMIVRACAQAGLPIILGRGAPMWKAIVPDIVEGLANGMVVEARNPRAATLSPANLGADLYKRVRSEIYFGQ